MKTGSLLGALLVFFVFWGWYEMSLTQIVCLGVVLAVCWSGTAKFMNSALNSKDRIPKVQLRGMDSAINGAVDSLRQLLTRGLEVLNEAASWSDPLFSARFCSYFWMAFRFGSLLSPCGLFPVVALLFSVPIVLIQFQDVIESTVNEQVLPGVRQGLAEARKRLTALQKTVAGKETYVMGGGAVLFLLLTYLLNTWVSVATMISVVANPVVIHHLSTKLLPHRD